ncbi:MAG TPA: hypothetical protein VFR49_13810 [Solirubrobacteraceae bacterium]|nr:hypothetical protein [Solirubrobacteraceae bacterium]
MRRTHKTRATLGLLAATAGLAACGGATKATSTTTTPASGPVPTRAQFITQADAICQEARASLSKLPTKPLIALGDTPKAFAAAAPLFRQIRSVEQAELGRLQGLRLPAGDNTEVTAYLQEGTQAVLLVGQIADAFAKGDKVALVAAEKEGNQRGAVAKGLAQGYGFKVCGHGTSGNGLT